MGDLIFVAQLAIQQHTEDELVGFLLSGNRDEFGFIYDHFSGPLFGVILKIIENNDSAQDILQESFVKIWTRRDQYDPSKGRLFTWMVNIARNSAIDATRSKHERMSAKIQNTEDNVRMIDRSLKVMPKEDTMDIGEVVNNLVPEQRIILDMMYFQGYSQDEVSKKLQLPLGTVKTRTRNALIKLRESFKILSE